MNHPCPYHEKRIKACTHKDHQDNHRFNKNKPKCSHKNPEDCDLYIEWLELKKSCARLAKNKPEDYPR